MTLKERFFEYWRSDEFHNPKYKISFYEAICYNIIGMLIILSKSFWFVACFLLSPLWIVPYLIYKKRDISSPNNIDESLSELGFIKIKEDDHGVQYKREIAKDGYTHRLDIVRKADGRNLIQSYEEAVNSMGFNNTVGLTEEEARLALKKMKMTFIKKRGT